MNKTQEYVKCGESEKLLAAAIASPERRASKNTIGYESPIKISSQEALERVGKVQTPSNECPSYGYADMSKNYKTKSDKD